MNGRAKRQYDRTLVHTRRVARPTAVLRREPVIGRVALLRGEPILRRDSRLHRLLVRILRLVLLLLVVVERGGDGV